MGKDFLTEKKSKGFIKVKEDPFEVEWSGIPIAEVKNMLVIYQEFKLGNGISELIEKQNKIQVINPEVEPEQSEKKKKTGSVFKTYVQPCNDDLFSDSTENNSLTIINPEEEKTPE